MLKCESWEVMELSNKAIDELRSLRLEYERKELLADVRFVKSYMDILASEEKYKGRVDLELTDGMSYYAEESFIEKDGKVLSCISVNIPKVFDASSLVLDIFKNIIPDYLEINAKNYFMMYSLLHESSHVWQDQALDDEEEVNRFYRLIVNKDYAKGIFYRYFSPERHANIDAHTSLIDIYDDSSLSTISKIFYLNLIIYLYGRLSPTEKTQLFLLSFEKFDMSKVSMMKRLEVGFPVEKEIIRQIDNELIREARGDIDFYECKKRIVRIANGIR